MDYPHPFIAREGWFPVALTLIAAVLSTLWLHSAWALLMWIISLLVIQFFRDPKRTLPAMDQALAQRTLVSPADGRVIKVEQTIDPYLQRQSIKVSIFMNVFNVHSNRVPINGRIQKRWYYPGKFFNADLDKASLENERNALWIQTESQHDVTCVQIAGLIARRILCYVDEGDALQQGARYGFIRFGSRVDLYLPTDSKLLVSLGDKVHATSSKIAELSS